MTTRLTHYLSGSKRKGNKVCQHSIETRVVSFLRRHDTYEKVWVGSDTYEYVYKHSGKAIMGIDIYRVTYHHKILHYFIEKAIHYLEKRLYSYKP